MTQEHYEHGPLVGAWLKEPTFVPAADLDRVSAAIARTPQRRNRLFRLPTLRFQPMLNATKAATAVAILGISGSLLASQLLGGTPEAGQAPAVGEGSSSPTAAASDPATESAVPDESVLGAQDDRTAPSVRLPGELASGVPSGTLDTPAGPARWVKLDRSESTVPGPGDVLPWTDGIAVWDSGTGPGALQATNDGVSWSPVALPDELRETVKAEWPILQQLEGVTYLYVFGSDRFWASDDGAWRPIDTSALSGAELPGWDTSIHFDSGLHLVDDRPVIAVRVRHHLPREQLGIPNNIRTRKMKDIGGQRHALCHPDGPCNARTATMVLRIKATDDGLVVRDDRTGERLGLMKGAKASDIYEGLRGIQKLWLAVEGDKLVRTGAPPRGWSEEESPIGPPPPSEELIVQELGDTWVAHGGGFFTPSPEPPWLYIGDEWFDTSEWGVPEPVSWWVGGAGNATLLWDVGENGSVDGLWVVEGPNAR